MFNLQNRKSCKINTKKNLITIQVYVFVKIDFIFEQEYKT